MIYLYAIIDQPGCPLPALSGLDETPLLEEVYQSIAAIYTQVPAGKDKAPPDTAPENLWKHEAVLESLMPAHAVLPLRFGSTYPSLSFLSALLQDKFATFNANLTRVRGCVELSLRMTWDAGLNSQPAPEEQPTVSAAPVSGREYMQKLLKTRQHEQQAQAQIEQKTGEILASLDLLAVENTRLVSLTPHPGLKAAYLIQHGNIETFQQEVGRLTAQHAGYHFTLTGPWPPYSFVVN